MAQRDTSNPLSADNAPATADEPQRALAALRARTPARILVGRSGTAYRTATQLALREDHAAAVDAVQSEFDVARDLPAGLVARFGIFEVTTRAKDKGTYLRQPELGRAFDDREIKLLTTRCTAHADLQVAIGDGLSAAAVRAQCPALVPALERGAQARGWSFGQVFAIRHCRVGIINAIGQALGPTVVVLLIGERPGLHTAESLSAYMAYRPRHGDTDAERNLVSNIHARGVDPAAAVARILGLAEQMRAQQTSGVAVKEQLASALGREGGATPALPERG